jgi:hypothetical protein
MVGSIKNIICIDRKKCCCLTYGVKQFCGYMVLMFIVLFFSDNAVAQIEESGESSIRNHQIWIDFYPHYFVNKKLEYYGDAGYRTIVNNGSWSRVYARPSLRYHISKTWGLHAGLGMFYIFNKDNVNQFEITPWQGVQINWPTLTRINFKHLFKLEERLSFKTKDWESSFEFRFRYKLFGNVSFVRTEKWYIPFYGEFFLPLEGKVQELYRNKGRAGIGLGFMPDKEWMISFVFNWQSSRSGSNERLNVSDYIYQLKIRKVWKRLIVSKK